MMNHEHTIVICRCEEITLEELKKTLQTYSCSSRELKLRTRAGMGYCGGRTCRSMIDAIIQESTGKTTENALKYQPPVRPISFGALGGSAK